MQCFYLGSWQFIRCDAASNKPSRITSHSMRPSILAWTWVHRSPMPVLDNAFAGTVHTVRIDLGSPALSQDPTANEARHRRILTSQ